MDDPLDAVTARAADQRFISQCSLTGLQDKLPFRWQTPPGIPPSPKRHYRSHYVYQGWQDLRDLSQWNHLSDFDLNLRLVDYSGLRPVLAWLLNWQSARGWCPFDPLSIFFVHGWQITNSWSRALTLQNLHNPRYADYANLFGFQDGIFPSEGGLRYYLTTLGANSQILAKTVQVQLDDARAVPVTVLALNHLIAGSTNLIKEAGIISQEAWRKAMVCPDGMIHDAASRLKCTAVQDTCYQPTTSQKPRPCPAKEKDHQGCDCKTADCAAVCRFATPRDPAARLVVYTGSNQPKSSPNQPATPPQEQPKGKGELRYGYRSVPLLLADEERRTSFILMDGFLPAPEREENPSAALLLQTPTFYPDLHLDAAAGDAGVGYASYLRAAHSLGVKRVVDLRADPSDQDKPGWTTRGYDDKGRPICFYGYAFTSNGYDPERKRHKWFCDKPCLTKEPPAVTLANVAYPPDECPYQAAKYAYGEIRNVALAFDDGSTRLVRDISVGTPAWKRIYHRARNAAEGRQATMERWRLKRLRVYGDLRGQAMIFQADVWDNLTTMARLVREATMAAGP